MAFEEFEKCWEKYSQDFDPNYANRNLAKHDFKKGWEEALRCIFNEIVNCSDGCAFYLMKFIKQELGER